MNHVVKILSGLMLCIVLAGGAVIGQVTIQSNGTGGGDWDMTTTWTGGVIPSNADTVIILGTDLVTVLAETSCADLYVNAGGGLTIAAKFRPKTVHLYGTITVEADSLLEDDFIAYDGGMYVHARNGGRLPVGFWAAGSTVKFTEVTSSAPSNRVQNFGNVVFDCPTQTSNLNMGWNNVTISGDITINSTGVGRWYMTAPLANDSAKVTVLGDIVQTSGNFSTNGTGNTNTQIYIYHYGNINVTGGNFALSRGSQGNVPTSLTLWHMLGGNITMSTCTTQNSNTLGYARFLFDGPGTQTLSLSDVTFAGGGMPIEVEPDATLLTGTSVTRGSGAFTVDSAATLIVGREGGLDSLMAGTGTKTLSKAAGYGFNGSAAQVTGALLPDTVANLIVDNAAGVTLINGTTVNNTLSVLTGTLALNGNTVVLGPAGMLSETPGNTVTGATGVITTTRALNAPNAGDNIAGMGVGIGSSADLGSTVITRGHAPQSLGVTAVKRYFDLTPTTNTGLNATLVFHYDESELNGASEADLDLYKSTDSGTTWNLEGGTVNTSANTVTLAGVNSLSRWSAGADFGGFVAVSYNDGWNLISNPVSASNDSVTVLFPAALFPYAFSFNAAGGYAQSYTMENGKGYWEKFSGAGSVNVAGSAITSDAIDVAAGWNIIGSISVPVDTGDVGDPGAIRVSAFFGYPYSPLPATIEPGKGYWVKTSAAGQFLLPAPSPSRPATGQNLLDMFDKVTFTDARGASQTLYVGMDDADVVPVDMYEMPPVGPEGTADARFASGRMVETYRSGEHANFPVRLTSMVAPVTVTWEVHGTLTLSDGAGATRSISGSGTTTLAGQNVVIGTRVAGVPERFSLYQNYPNPFNPSTEIAFTVEATGPATLDVYNVLGQRVASLFNGIAEAGKVHNVHWSGDALGAGVYYYRLQSKGKMETRSMVLLK